MKWTANDLQITSRSYVIEIYRDEYYLYVYENGIDTHDYIKGSLEAAQNHAYSIFGVPIGTWTRVE